MSETLYLGRGGAISTSDLYGVDSGTAVATSIGASGFALTGIAYDPVGTVLYGATSTNSTAHPNSLVTLNTSTGAGTFVGAFGVVLSDISVDSSGAMFGYCPSDNKLYSVNKSTGVATAVGSSGLGGTTGNGLAFDATDVLWLFPFNTNGNYYTVNTSTGAASSVGVLSGVTTGRPVQAATAGASAFYLLYGQASTGRLATVDLVTGIITLIGDTTINSADALGSTSSPTPPCGPAPPNDDYPTGFTPFFSADYYLGSNSGGCLDSTNKCATAQAGEPDPDGVNPPFRTVWFTYESPYTGTLRVTVSPSSAGMAGWVSAAYDYVTGPPSGLGASIATGSSGSPNMDIPVVAGNDYAIQVDTLTAGDGGTFTLLWHEYSATPPANDDFANAIVLIGLCGDMAVSLSGGSAECGEPTGTLTSPDGPYNTVWYEWTPAYTGIGIFRIAHVTAGFHDLDLEIFTGTGLGDLVEVASHEFSGTPSAPDVFAFNIVSGTTYWVRWQARGENLTFNMVYETDQNDWQARCGWFTVGSTSFNTGLGVLPKAVIFFVSGAPSDGSYQDDGMRQGIGAATGTGQWCSAMSYPWQVTGVSGDQYGQPFFDSTHAISMLDVLGTPYAQASVTGFHASGTIDLSWDTIPGDGTTVGFLAVGGTDVTAAIGTGTFSGVGSTTITPGVDSRLFLTSNIAANPGDPGIPGGAAPATSWAWGWLTEGGTATVEQGMFGVELGIRWTGARGFFELGGNVGLHVFYNDTAASGFSPNFSYQLTNDANWETEYGWLSLGGCGYHTLGWTVNPQFSAPEYPPYFWTNAAGYSGGKSEIPVEILDGLAYAAAMGATDETNRVFDMTNTTIPDDGVIGSPPPTNFQTPVYRDYWQDRMSSVPGGGGLHDVEFSHWDSVLPGRPNLGGTITQVPGGDSFQAIAMFLLGNYYPPVAILTGPVSFSHLTTSQKRVGLRVR